MALNCTSEMEIVNKSARNFHEKEGAGVSVVCDGEFVQSAFHGYGSYDAYKKWNEDNPNIVSLEILKHDDNGFVYDKSIIGRMKPPVYFKYNDHLYCETYLDGVHDILGSIVAVEEWKIIGFISVGGEDVTDMDLNDDKEPEVESKMVEKTLFVFVAINASGDCLCIASFDSSPIEEKEDWPELDLGGLDFDEEIKEDIKAVFCMEDILNNTLDPFGDF